MSIAFGASTFVAQANNDGTRVWTPGQPVNPYWQAPNWPERNAQRPAPSTPPANSPGYPGNNYPQNNTSSGTPPPPPGPYTGSPAPRKPTPVQRQVQRSETSYRGAPAPRPPAQQYNEPSAFYTPGYNPYRSYRNRNNRWGSNKFWGNSGPSKWMNPSKRNWENSWDDMINAPSRMGEMPGGWTAPEVSVPNPIDMGDQMQDNVRDLPEQMKDGNIGNNVSN